MFIRWLGEFPDTLLKIKQYHDDSGYSYTPVLTCAQEMRLVQNYLETQGFDMHSRHNAWRMESEMWVTYEGRIFTGNAFSSTNHQDALEAICDLMKDCVVYLEYGKHSKDSSGSTKGGKDA